MLNFPARSGGWRFRLANVTPRFLFLSLILLPIESYFQSDDLPLFPIESVGQLYGIREQQNFSIRTSASMEPLDSYLFTDLGI